MSKVLWLIETIILFIFSYIIPKKESLILFGSMKWRYIWWNPKIFYLYLDKYYEWKYELCFFDGNRTNEDNRIKTYWFWFKKYWLILRAKYLFIDACSFDLGVYGVLFGRFNLIQLWHWEPIKKIWFLSEEYIKRRNKIVLFFEKLEYKTYKIIVSNPWSKEILEKCFLNKNVYNVWVPRNDILLDKKIWIENENKIVKEFVQKLKKQFSKVILFSPTFRETDFSDYFSDSELKKLNEILSEKWYVLIIKKHINEKRKILWNKKFYNIIDVTEQLNYDSIDFLPYVDFLMTDYSSIFIDFLLTWKWILFYQPDLDNYIYKERWLLYEPTEIVIKSVTAYNFEMLIDNIKWIELISKSKEYKKSYEKLYNIFFRNLDRNTSSCHRIYNLIFNDNLWKK